MSGTRDSWLALGNTHLINRHKDSTRSRLFREDSDLRENGGFFVSEQRV